MPPSAAQTDLPTFLDRLSFNRQELAEMKAQVHASAETRRVAEETVRDAAGGGGLKTATACYLLSRPGEALDTLGDADGNQASLVRGLASLEAGDPSTAATAFGSLVGTDMEGPQMLADLATASALSGDSGMAKKAAQKLPEGADAAYAEGIALESDGEYEEARQSYERAIEADPKHARALFRLAHRHDLDGRDAKAIEIYQRVAQLTPTYVNALVNLGLLYEDHGRYQEAEGVYRRVLKADPTHVRAKAGLRDVQASQHMYYDEDHERREDRRNQILRTPITEFELSVRSRNCLSKMNIETLGDLVRKTEAELLAYKNFGETSLQEIKDILAQKGLRLGMTQDDDTPLVMQRSMADDDAVNALFGAPLGGAAPANANEPTAMPIERLELSIRARRCMDNLNIRTVGDLLQHTEAELLASKNFGQTSLNEVRRKLEGLGLTLKRK